MKYVIGLGNPGDKYSNTRHNIGFRVVDEAARIMQENCQWVEHKNMVLFKGEDVTLIKPLTYMNNSGEVFDYLDEEIIAEDLLVVVDEVNIPLGRQRFRESGSCGGHNGLASIEMALATDEYPRLRIGVGFEDSPVTGEELVDFVLEDFSETENELLEKVIKSSAEAVVCWLRDGMQIAQRRFNGIDLGAM